jgi:hypothetical protein
MKPLEEKNILPSSVELNFSAQLNEVEKQVLYSWVERMYPSKFISGNYAEGYEIIFTLGDWSGDGHGISEDFIINSSKPVEYLRELYFSFEKRIPEFSLSSSIPLEGKIAKKSYNIPVLFGVNYEEKFRKRDFDWKSAFEELGVVFPEKIQNAIEEDWVGQSEFIEILLSCLRYEDPSLRIEVSHSYRNERKQIFHHYGFDEKQRHIGFFGYGLFNY